MSDIDPAGVKITVSRGTYRAVDIFKALGAAGWVESRISGSHHIFTRAGHRCLPVAVHGGKLRRDVVQHVLRHASMPAPTFATEHATESVAAAETEPPAPTGSAVSAPISSRRPADEHRWADSSAEEQAQLGERAQRADSAREAEAQGFEQALDAAQLELLDGSYAALDARLAPLLSDGGEKLAQRCGYERVADAHFFLTTALCSLAMAQEQQQQQQQAQQKEEQQEQAQQGLVARAFDSCRKLLVLRERRDDARALLGSLLSWVYCAYVGQLLTLATGEA